MRLRVVLFRHGPAELRDPARWPRDEQRPLSAKGIVQTRRAARGLVRAAGPVDLVATSAAVRARMTTEALAGALGTRVATEVWEELAVGRLAGAILERLHALPRARRSVVLVGHEPALAELAGLALVGDGVPIVKLAKAGAVLVEFPSAVAPGAARLRWALTRKQLVALRS